MSAELDKLNKERKKIEALNKEELETLAGKTGAAIRTKKELAEMTRRSTAGHGRHKAVVESDYQDTLKEFNKNRKDFKDSMARGYDNAQSIMGEMIMQSIRHSKLMSHAINQTLGVSDFKHAAVGIMKQGLVLLKNAFKDNMLTSTQRDNLMTGMLHIKDMINLNDDNTFPIDTFSVSGMDVSPKQNSTFHGMVLNWLETQGYTLQKDAKGKPSGLLVNASQEVLTQAAFKTLRDDPNNGLAEYFQKDWPKPDAAPRPRF